ncbi:MAG: hypothetical protein CVU61_06100 [Deltaproteobacteria bacterium HGW-Deltaproteobacteria-19]|jgi:hypothetical protein|nr:MAG: hypothetical protein CVU61_06100 [Deltaproteobacteria bacterium HGW-Deltaproteobacteria-19]
MDTTDSEKRGHHPDPGATPEPEEDFWNCKGQCGYTRWCAACIAERKEKELEKERQRHESGDY